MLSNPNMRALTRVENWRYAQATAEKAEGSTGACEQTPPTAESLLSAAYSTASAQDGLLFFCAGRISPKLLPNYPVHVRTKTSLRRGKKKESYIFSFGQILLVLIKVCLTAKD